MNINLIQRAPKTTNIHASKKQNTSSEDRVSMPQQSCWLRLDNTFKSWIIENSVDSQITTVDTKTEGTTEYSFSIILYYIHSILYS